MCKFGRAATGSLLQSVVAEMLAVWLDVADVGSPQLPPGGGLLLCAAGLSARLRNCLGRLRYYSAAGFFAQIDPAGIGGPQPGGGGGPQLLIVVRTSAGCDPKMLDKSRQF